MGSGGAAQLPREPGGNNLTQYPKAEAQAGPAIPARLGIIQRESEASKDAAGERLRLNLPLPKGSEQE